MAILLPLRKKKISVGKTGKKNRNPCSYACPLLWSLMDEHDSSDEPPLPPHRSHFVLS